MIIKRHMDEEILELRGMIADISTAVRGMLDLCIKPLAELTGDDFDRVFDLEIDVNRYQIKIDDLAWKIMALYQPTASDLRLLIGAIKISSDFERAGFDGAVPIRRHALFADAEVPFSDHSGGVACFLEKLW